MENTAKIEVAQDLRQSGEYGRYMERIGWKTITIKSKHKRVQIFVRKLGPVSIAKIQRVELPLLWEELDKILKENRVFMCKLEPNYDSRFRIQNLRMRGFKQDNWPMLGTKTLRIGLSGSLSIIYDSFKKDCRYGIRNAQNSIFNVQLNKLDDFYNMWRRANRIKKLWTPPKRDYDALVQSFGEKCFCITINNLAGCLVLLHKNTAFYYFSGSLPEGKKLNFPYLAVWEALKEAKKRGCKEWDFEGIYDNRWPNNGWKGFTHFKKSFGGTEVEYCGSFIMWRLPI